jgi:hypothetical protein
MRTNLPPVASGARVDDGSGAAAQAGLVEVDGDLPGQFRHGPHWTVRRGSQQVAWVR